MKFLLRFCCAATVILAPALESFAAPRVLNNCTTITESGAYVVGRNLSATGDCFVIATDFVQLDFDGFVARGNGSGAGVTQTMVSPTQGRRGIVLKNGYITGFASGVSLDWSTGARLENMNVSGNSGDGAFLGESASVVGTTVSNNGHDGLVLGIRNLAQGNTVSNNANLGVLARQGAIITGNSVGQNGHSGIVAGEGALISNNVSRSNGFTGIAADCPSLVIGNTSSNNQGANLAAGGGVCDPNSVLCCVSSVNNMTMQ